MSLILYKKETQRHKCNINYDIYSATAETEQKDWQSNESIQQVLKTDVSLLH